MADILLSNTSLLTFKCDATIIIPRYGKHNSATVKAVVDMLKYADPEIIFAGDEVTQPPLDKHISGDGLYARIHVLNPPALIDFTLCASQTKNWFIKQLRGNKEYIVFTSTVDKPFGTQTVIDIYVRGILVPVRDNKVHKINQPAKRFDYAV